MTFNELESRFSFSSKWVKKYFSNIVDYTNESTEKLPTQYLKLLEKYTVEKQIINNQL